MWTSLGLRFVEPYETLWLKGRNQGTSRLWVSRSEIPWDSVVCNHYWLSMLYKIIIFFESQKIPLTEIKCLRIVYAKIWHDSTRPLVSRFHFVRLMQTHFTSMKCQIGISKCVQSRPSFFIISQTTQISETTMLFLMYGLRNSHVSACELYWFTWETFLV